MNKHLINHRPTEEMLTLNAAHHIQPFTDGKVTKSHNIRVITRAEGIYFYDSEGGQILDGMAGLWCVNIGYGRNELADVAHRQMQQLPYYNTFFQTTHPPVIELAAKLAELTPKGLNHTFFANSGSEANDTNIRFVRHYWASLGKPEKSVIISRENAYHGSSMGSASLGGMTYMHEQGGMPIADIVHIEQPYWWVNGGDMSPEEYGLHAARALERKIEELGADKVAAFIGEPIQGAGGVIVPPETYWPEIQRICREHDILLIADEVICGFGRCGTWFGSQALDIQPDIMTIAKGLSSGYMPISGSVVSEKVAETFANEAGAFNHGYTYSGHPVAAAVALENIRILEEEKIVETCAKEVVPYFGEQWATLGDHPLVGETRQLGMLAAIQISADKEGRKPFKETGEVAMVLRDKCIENGVMLRAIKDNLAASPPLTISRDQVDEMIAKLSKSLDQAYDHAKKEGMLVTV